MNNHLRSIAVGCYHFVIPVITIEASERVPHPQAMTFLHESTHKFFTELTDLGYLARRVCEFFGHSAFEHPFVSSYISTTRSVQEILATNLAHLLAPNVGVSREFHSKTLSKDYSNYLYTLKEFHAYLIKNIDKDSHLILLQLGLLALGAPGFTELNAVNLVEQDINWESFFKQNENDPEHRFNVAVESLRNCISLHGSHVEKVIQALVDDCSTGGEVVTASRINCYAESLVYGDWRDLVVKSANGYGEDGVSLGEYYHRVKYYAARATAVHFNCRIYLNQIDGEVLLKLIQDENCCFLHFYHNFNEFDTQQVVDVPAGMCLVFWAVYDRTLADGKGRSPYDAKLEDAGYSLVSYKVCQEMLKIAYGKPHHIIVGEWMSFDPVRREYMQMRLPENKTVLLHRAFLNEDLLERMFFSFADVDMRVHFHFVHEHDSSTRFACLSPQDGDGWMFISPFSPDLREIIETNFLYPTEYVNNCASLGEFGITNFMETQIVAFIRHYNKWGW